LERVKQKYNNVTIYNGYDEIFLAGLIMGADGGIGSTYNFMAEKFIKIRKLFRENKINEAQKIMTSANEIIKVLIKVGVLPGEKEILNMMGLGFGECRKPFRRLDDESKKLLRDVCLANGVLIGNERG
jgi:N-acetylneuraminate lyase